jgi:CRISPR-associated protein Cst2
MTGWPSSEIKAIKVNVKGNTSKLAGQCDPVGFVEDDAFGYMRTEPKVKKTKGTSTEEENDEIDAEITEVKEQNIQVKGLQRTAPLSTPILRSIRQCKTISIDEGWVHPKIGTPNPYSTEFYSTTLEGWFGLDYKRLGLFSNIGDKVELDESKIAALLKAKQIILVGNGESKTYEMTNAEESRKERSAAILKALAALTGGAKQAAFATDLTPHALVFAGLTCANPFLNKLFIDNGKEIVLDIERLVELVKDFADKIHTSVYIGIRKHYLANEKEVRKLAETEIDGIDFVVDTPISVVNQMCSEFLNGHADTEEMVEVMEGERVESTT